MTHDTTIGILLPRLNAGYDKDVLAGAHAIAQQHGVQLLAIWGAPGDRRTTTLAGDHIDGWIAVLNIPRPDSLRDVVRVGIPAVVIGALPPDLAYPAVLPDNRGGTLAAVRHLLDHGHQRIAFVGDLRFDDMRERYAAYEAALTERGLAVDSRYVFANANYYGAATGGALAAQRMVDEGFPCSAMVAGNDLYALQVMESIRQAGYHVPEHLAVVGFDDLAEAQYATPPLTTVRQSYSLLGRTAAELLMAQLRGQTVPPGPTYVPTTLVVRRSCGCALSSASSDPSADDAYAAPGWQTALAQQLVRLALHPLPLDPATPPEQIWPSVGDLVQGLETALTGARPPDATGMERAWREAVGLTASLESLDGMLRALERAGEQRAGGASRLRSFLDSARLGLMRAQQARQIAQDGEREELIRTGYAISMALLGQEQGDVAQLAWLSLTPLLWGCLGLWAEPGDETTTLVIAGSYSRDGEHTIPIGARYAAAAFPPPQALPAAARAGGSEVVFLLPVRTATHDWGVLAVCRSVTSRSAQLTDEDVRMWATLLGAALERQSLLESLTGRQDTLSLAYEQRLITENIRDLIFMIDQAGRFLYTSPSFQHVLGYSPTRLLGISAFDLIHPDDVDTVREPWAQVTTPGTLQATFRLRHASGLWRWLEVSGTVVIRQGLPAVVVVGRDVTERKRLEAEVLQSQKIESIGRLAGGIAHDFNNLLTAIGGYADLLLASTQPAAPARDDLEEILKAVRRATSLTNQLLAFARKQVIESRVLNLNDLILDMDRLLRRLIGEHIELATLPAPGLWYTKVDPSQIEQLVINLAINARDAMPAGGRLTIATANTTIDQTHARALVGVAPGAYVLLEVRDTGVGMSAEVQSHLFEPFFTTKAPGQGTGLGLATCYGIVKQHGGHISIQSEVDQGTTVAVLLPSVEESAVVSLRHEARPALAGGAETVLLVEDEQAVRSLAARVLRARGYTILEAANGAEALQVAREHHGTIDLLLTDVVMPYLGGVAAAEQLMAMRPGIKVLFMSGYTDKAVAGQSELDPNAPFLMKPYTPSVLAHKVREVLDA
jgi:PAS domain S-box-containing protein